VRTPDGSLISAMAGEGLKPAARTTLALRPERISLDPDANLTNRFKATVEELIYHGDHLRLRVKACGCDDVRIKVTAGRAASQFVPGAPIQIGWSPDDCRALALS
jgi:putative spermidine/putrescine transport system ATP-binding protein